MSSDFSEDSDEGFSVVTFFATRDEDEIVVPGCELVREFDPEPSGGTGDECSAGGWV